MEYLVSQGPGEAGIHAQNDLALIYAALDGRFPVIEFLPA